jgi:hypothetical protein
MLISASIAGLVLIVGFVLFSRHLARRSVGATITKIQVAAGSISSGWRVTAEWAVPLTGQALTFPARISVSFQHITSGSRSR